jgi:hypothetical protein
MKHPDKPVALVTLWHQKKMTFCSKLIIKILYG